MADDMRSAQNSALLDTSFLYGGNAVFVEQQYAKWAANPASVDASWASFFAGMGDGAGDAQRAASGPSWKRNDWPKSEVGEWVATLDGNWALIEPKIEKKPSACSACSLQQEEESYIRCRAREHNDLPQQQETAREGERQQQHEHKQGHHRRWQPKQQQQQQQQHHVDTRSSPSKGRRRRRR